MLAVSLCNNRKTRSALPQPNGIAVLTDAPEIIAPQFLSLTDLIFNLTAPPGWTSAWSRPALPARNGSVKTFIVTRETNRSSRATVKDTEPRFSSSVTPRMLEQANLIYKLVAACTKARTRTLKWYGRI